MDTSPSAPSEPTLSLDGLQAVIFDLDGVLTDTASLHEQAWAATFGAFFAGPASDGRTVRPFEHHDYVTLVDGRPRLDGARAVLADRGLTVPEGSPADPPTAPTVAGLARAKDDRYSALLAGKGPRPFPGVAALLRRLQRAGVPVAVVTASRHGGAVLEAAGLAGLVDTLVDGRATAAMALAGKPAPDTFLEAARRLGALPRRAVVVEDAVAGVTAGHRGGFGVVVGVDRTGSGDLARAGAHLVVAGVGQLSLQGLGPAEDDWHLHETGDDPGREGVRETLCTLGNGYVATRGARSDAVADAVHYPGTYFAGVYDRSRMRVAGHRVEREAVVNAPNWLWTTLGLVPGDGRASSAAPVRRTRWVRLDMRRGLLERRVDFVGDGWRTSVFERRLVSMADPNLAAAELTVVPEDWSGVVEVCSGIDGDVADAGTVEEQLLPGGHLVSVRGAGADADGVRLTARTSRSGVVLAEVARISPTAGDVTGTSTWSEGSRVERRLQCAVDELGRVTVEKLVGLCTSRDAAVADPVTGATATAGRAAGFDAVLASHERAWAELWKQVDIDIGGVPPELRRALRLHVFHLLQVASPHVVGRDVGLPARGLHGEGYLGHVFWDELFVLPALSLRLPEVARSLLGYRTRRLGAAQAAAAAAGLAGAMFPWQSGSDGRDETPTILFNPRSGHWIPDHSHLQRHVGLAVAYSFWQHFQATGDVEHLVTEGVPILVEVARCFASLARFDPILGRYRITGVMGPDEFHDGYPWRDEPGVDDNAYTNVMAAWLFARIGDLAERLHQHGRTDVLEHVALGAAELTRFDRLSRSLHVPFLADGVIAQFDGYDRLAPIDLDAYRQRYGTIGRLDLILEAEGDAVRRYQVTKQADVLMLLYLLSAEELRGVLGRLGYPLPPVAVRRTVAHYAGRVVDGSSLSAIVHAWVMARGNRRASWGRLVDALAVDIHDSQGGTTREGIHLGAMAGTVDILTRCYPGLELRSEALWLHPRLPREVGWLSYPMRYRGHLLRIAVDGASVSLAVEGGPDTPLTVLVDGHPHTLHTGERLNEDLR